MKGNEFNPRVPDGYPEVSDVEHGIRIVEKYAARRLFGYLLANYRSYLPTDKQRAIDSLECWILTLIDDLYARGRYLSGYPPNFLRFLHAEAIAWGPGLGLSDEEIDYAWTKPLFTIPDEFIRELSGAARWGKSPAPTNSGWAVIN